MTPVTLTRRDPVHFLNGADRESMTKAIEDINQMFLTGAITYQKCCSFRFQLLQFVAQSHRPVISNLFII